MGKQLIGVFKLRILAIRKQPSSGRDTHRFLAEVLGVNDLINEDLVGDIVNVKFLNQVDKVRRRPEFFYGLISLFDGNAYDIQREDGRGIIVERTKKFLFPKEDDQGFNESKTLTVQDIDEIRRNSNLDPVNNPDDYIVGNDTENEASYDPTLTDQDAAEFNSINQYLKKLEKDGDINPTVKEQLTRVRVGQGRFRDKVVELWDGKCVVTQVGKAELLIASHIRAWADCDDPKQKLDKYNGLLLAPHIDKLFDQHLITFNADGTIKADDTISKILQTWGIDVNKLKPVQFEEKTKEYMKYHRSIYDKNHNL
jgi:hypothetical protein